MEVLCGPDRAGRLEGLGLPFGNIIKLLVGVVAVVVGTVFHLAGRHLGAPLRLDGDRSGEGVAGFYGGEVAKGEVAGVFGDIHYVTNVLYERVCGWVFAGRLCCCPGGLVKLGGMLDSLDDLLGRGLVAPEWCGGA